MPGIKVRILPETVARTREAAIRRALREMLRLGYARQTLVRWIEEEGCRADGD